MIAQALRSIPDLHKQALTRIVETLRVDDRIVGVAAGGSLLGNAMDEFSDLDLVIAVEPEHYSNVLAERAGIAASLGKLLAAFTGEHVGEPRLLICLYGDPLLHIDLKFVSLEDVAGRVEDPVVIWERAERFTMALAASTSKYPCPNLQWIEDRFWVWVHYGATKIGRGELFEALGFLSFLRDTVLGPLGLQQAGVRPTGVRKIEFLAPDFAKELQLTLAGYEVSDCLRALRASVELYRSLRPSSTEVEPRQDAEKAAMDYLSDLELRFGQIRR